MLSVGDLGVSVSSVADEVLERGLFSRGLDRERDGILGLTPGNLFLELDPCNLLRARTSSERNTLT